MRDASTYPVTFPYGATSPPYGTASMPYHRGDDRAMPTGTPVIVNGVTIGLSGSTGASTGPHLHIGQFVGGQDKNPLGQGFTLDNATVTEIGSDATNGNFVRVHGSGVDWVYLHLSNNKLVKVGDKLQGGNMQPYTYNEDEFYIAWKLAFDRDPSQEEAANPKYRDPKFLNATAWNNGGKERFDAIKKGEYGPTNFTNAGEVDGKPVFRQKS